MSAVLNAGCVRGTALRNSGKKCRGEFKAIRSLQYSHAAPSLKYCCTEVRHGAEQAGSTQTVTVPRKPFERIDGNELVVGAIKQEIA
jgi:hypothetical protein